MLPPFIVAALHLGFKESPELALDGPSYAITLLVPALDYVLAVREYVCVYPYALSENRLRDFLRHLIFLSLGALNHAPESLAAPMRVLA